MTSREQFEIKFPVPAGVTWNPETCRYVLVHLKRASVATYETHVERWVVWQASRAALVVELPDACAYEGLTQELGSHVELSYEPPEHDPVGLIRLADTRAAIEASGVKVKS